MQSIVKQKIAMQNIWKQASKADYYKNKTYLILKLET